MNLRNKNAGEESSNRQASTAKEKYLRSISIPDRISGTARRILWERLRELGGM